MSQDDLSILVTRPIAVTILILAAVTTITGIRRQRSASRQEAVLSTTKSDKGSQNENR